MILNKLSEGSSSLTILFHLSPLGVRLLVDQCPDSISVPSMTSQSIVTLDIPTLSRPLCTVGV